MADPIVIVPSRAALKRVRGGRDGLYPFLELLSPDVTQIIPPAIGEFGGDTLHAGFQSTASGAASVAAAISTGSVNGAILLDAGTANDGRSDLSWGLHAQGQLNCVIYCRMQINTITAVKFEIGFTDVVSGTDAGAVDDLSVPSFNANNFVGWVFDTDDTANLQGAGNRGGVVATKVEDASIVNAAAAVYQTYVVAVRDASAQFRLLNVDGREIYRSDWMTNAVSLNTNLTPWVFVQNRSGSQRTMLIDTLLCWQRRTT